MIVEEQIPDIVTGSEASFFMITFRIITLFV